MNTNIKNMRLWNGGEGAQLNGEILKILKCRISYETSRSPVVAGSDK